MEEKSEKKCGICECEYGNQRWSKREGNNGEAETITDRWLIHFSVFYTFIISIQILTAHILMMWKINEINEDEKIDGWMKKKKIKCRHAMLRR